MAAWCADFTRRAVGPVFGFYGPQDLAALPLHLLGAGFVSVMAVPFANAVSRRNERFAMFDEPIRISSSSTVMTFETALLVLALTCTMCLVSGALAVRKVHSADPADLF